VNSRSPEGTTLSNDYEPKQSTVVCLQTVRQIVMDMNAAHNHDEVADSILTRVLPLFEAQAGIVAFSSEDALHLNVRLLTRDQDATYSRWTTADLFAAGDTRIDDKTSSKSPAAALLISPLRACTWAGSFQRRMERRGR